jgi:hypothetical protein
MCKWEQGEFAAEGCWGHRTNKCRNLHRDQLDSTTTIIPLPRPTLRLNDADQWRRTVRADVLEGQRDAGSSSKKVLMFPRGRNGGQGQRQPTLQKAANAFVVSTAKTGNTVALVKDTLKEISQRLNKLTLEKFGVLALQIKDLVVVDLALIEKLVAIIYAKAVDEAFFSMIYAKLCKYLAEASNENDGGTPPTKTVPAIAVFRKSLLICCQREFEKATSADVGTANSVAVGQTKEHDPARTSIPINPTKTREAEREAEYARSKIKRHMLGNIRFIGELFKEDLVSSKIMLHCINHLMPDKNADTENLENLCTLLETAGGKWETQMLRVGKKGKKEQAANQAIVAQTFATMKAITVRPKLSPRIKFAMLDILDLRARKWQSTVVKGPKTISEVHAASELEQIKIQQHTHSTNGHGKVGGGGGDGKGKTLTSSGWTAVATTPRRPEKVDASRFGGYVGGSITMRLGAPRLGGIHLKAKGRAGLVKSGRSSKPTGGSNPFAALNIDGSDLVPERDASSPLLQPPTPPTVHTGIMQQFAIQELAADKAAFEAADRILSNHTPSPPPPPLLPLNPPPQPLAGACDVAAPLLSISTKHADEWNTLRSIGISAAPVANSIPSAAEMTLLKERKQRLKALLAAVDTEGKAWIQNEEAVLKRTLKAAAKVDQRLSKINAVASNNGSAVTVVQQEARAAAKSIARKAQADAALIKAEKTAERSVKQRAAALHGVFTAVCTWFDVALQQDKQTVGLWEIELPEWLLAQEEYLDQCELDAGLVLLETDELEEALLAAADVLGVAYFGADFTHPFDLQNLGERAATASMVGTRDGLPPWFECKTEPPLMAEVYYSCTALTIV